MTNQTTTDSNSGEFLVTTRRTFHLAAIYVLGALISLALAIPTVIYLLVPRKVESNLPSSMRAISAS